MVWIASCAELQGRIGGCAMSKAFAPFGFAESSLCRYRRANACERCLSWEGSDWMQFLLPDLSHFRPTDNCQHPDIGCSWACWYQAAEKTGVSTIWLLRTSSKGLWKNDQQLAALLALSYLVELSNHQPSLFWAQRQFEGHRPYQTPKKGRFKLLSLQNGIQGKKTR